MKNKNNGINIKLFLGILPFILIISIGLIPGNITYHQKVFKTLLIFISDIIILAAFLLYFIRNNNPEGLKKTLKYISFFALYFIYILIQYIASFLSGEISYDREYYLANYAFLIIFSLFIYLVSSDIENAEYGVFLFGFMFFIIFVWIMIEFALKGFRFQNYRPDISFGNTDYFAGFMIGIIPLSITGFVLWLYKYFENSGDDKKFKYILINIANIIFLPMGIISLIFSQTKAAFLGFFLSLILLFTGIIFITVKKKLTRFLLIVPAVTGIIAAALILFIYKPPFFTVVFNRFIYASENFNFVMKDRTENAWAGGLGLFKNHPVTGAGLGTVYPASFKFIGKLFYIYSTSNSFKHTHCEYVEILGEGGIIGILFFSLLILLILVPLLIRAFSGKYLKNYRLLCLGASAGIISMLIHQAFSLSLRMSVTMAAFFFLLGFAVFLLSLSKRSKLDYDDSQEYDESGKNLLVRPFDKNGFMPVFFGSSLLIIISAILFTPLLLSENNLINALKKYNNDQYKAIKDIIEAKDKGDKTGYDKALKKYRSVIESVNRHYSNAVKFKKDNVYAWTDKYAYDMNSNLVNAGSDSEKEKVLIEIKKDVDTLNSIIPLYQDIWLKYTSYYFKLNEYYLDKGDYTNAAYSLREALNSINKSLSINFLNESFHLYRLHLLQMFNDQEGHNEALKEYIAARIYLNYSKNKKTVKEKIVINPNADKSYFKTENGLYYFYISNDDTKNISMKFFSKSYTEIENSILQMYLINEVKEFIRDKYSEADR